MFILYMVEPHQCPHHNILDELNLLDGLQGYAQHIIKIYL